ncbi:hypothetical protein KY495_18775 [Massilia sp. PAMC28688]|uniref:hypothetical protein n=1 Tax=Massilia sp. PAMC28688 TaxID=2861283 RepID=UPI001C631EAA|nr:hypothetical protein [Massilia sp. PAMC28688]QYF92752.1 hypothetical protein KY495_18775 [Massilia sp. PAMC28688]
MKVSLLIVLVLGLSWMGAIWYWRATNRMPAPGDMLVFLVAIPLGILASIWVGRVVLQKMAAAPAPAATGAPADAQAAPPAPKAPPLALLAAAIRAPHGASAADLSGKLIEGKARAELDAELVNDQGFPVMTVRCADADDTAIQDEITEWFEQNGVQELEVSAEQWRALTLATAVAGELADEASANLLPPEGAPPMLYLQPMLPPEWSLELRSAAGLWLRHVIITAGWPDKQLSLAATVPSDARGASPAAVLGRVAHQANTSGVPLAAIVMTCASHLGEACIERWASSDILFAAARPQGRIPGEGAAGLLLIDHAQAVTLPELPHMLLQLEPETRRHNSADEAKKADAKALATMSATLLAATGTEAAKVAMLVTDTDHRTSRVMEMMELASATLPHLDTASEVLAVGSGCGSAGAVSFVTALALGHHHATELAAPVLCISNDDPYRRSAILIQPAAALS